MSLEAKLIEALGIHVTEIEIARTQGREAGLAEGAAGLAAAQQAEANAQQAEANAQQAMQTAALEFEEHLNSVQAVARMHAAELAAVQGWNGKPRSEPFNGPAISAKASAWSVLGRTARSWAKDAGRARG